MPILIGVPHGGRRYPKEVVDTMRGGDLTRRRLEDRHIDTVALALAAETSADALLANVPRAILDLNRAPDDIDWSMVEGRRGRESFRHSAANRRARSGLGLVPRRLPGLGEIWKAPIEASEIERRISLVHTPYHRALGNMLANINDRWGAALLIDLHSMPPLKQRYAGEEPAEIVIGDRFGASCHPNLSAFALQYLAEQGRRVAHNRPYSGGYVLDRHAAPRRGMHAMQIEICRSLYLDAELDQPTARLGAVVKLLTGLVRGLAREVADLGNTASQPLAAE
ncbi:N-formylglutamate amidohydrolase [Erythrobacter litoralis]|uniref:N-formylglutamate amidohydrolase n=1 Tax=Erythrobacter litoralis TaxID=39960 RepID=UPI002435A9A7|nr:N-formylglutamate amidohydrolase [Erythrobacter litoralis]MDG6079611.1 N-formylglutamate amidohydrolase [Erythrobacter litoralis]